MQAFDQALASQLGITTDRLHQAMSAARTQAGMTGRSAQAGGANHAGQAGHRPGPGGRRPGGTPFMGPLSPVAQAIGITTDQLRQELPGKSLAQVAQAHGKNPSDVAAALKTAADQRIDDMMNHVFPAAGAGAAFPGSNGTPRAFPTWSGTRGPVPGRNGTPAAFPMFSGTPQPPGAPGPSRRVGS